MGKIKPNTQRSRSKTTWLGMELEKGSAQIIFFFALVGAIFSFIWILVSAFSLINYISLMGYIQTTIQTQTYAGYTGYSLTWLICYLIIAFGVFIFCIYTIRRTREIARGN